MNVSRAATPALLLVVSILAVPLTLGDRAAGPEVRPDRPGEALAFRSLSLRGDSGEIPADGLMRAHRHAALMKERLASAATMADPDGSSAALSAALTRTGWNWIGPGNVGGRVRALVVHPTATNTMFAGSVSGGIWTTANGGASWAPVDDFMANLAVTSIVFDPVNPQVMYAATGEGFSNADAIRGAGIFKSVDAGATWRQLAATNVPGFHYVLRLAISPDGRRLLAGTTAGLFRSTDGGTTWTRSTTAPPAFDVDFHPQDSRRAVVGDRNGCVWYTVDSGATWTRALLTLPSTASGSLRVEVAYAKGTPDIVYAVVDRDEGVVFRSIDGGASFTETFHSDDVRLLENGQGWYDLALWVNPFDANDLIVGGVNLHRSRDGGLSFTAVSSWHGALHADQHVLVEHPRFDNAENRTVFVGNDGGVYRIRDLATLTSAANAVYEELNNSLGVTQFYGAAGNASTGVIVGGTQDNGTLVYDPASGSEGWSAMFGGDGGFSAADPADPSYFYGEYVYLQLHRSANGGRSSSFIYTGLADAGHRANFIAPFILDPNVSRRMLAGGQSLWRSNDVRAAAPAWQAIKPGTSGNYIGAIAVAQGTSNLIWVGHNNGDLYRTTNGAASSPSWTKMDPTSLPNRFVTRITIDPFDPSIIYAAFGGFADQNIQRSNDGGVSWTDATGTGATGLPLAPVRDVEVDPTDSNAVWAGTEVGIFTSRDRGATWDATHDGPANVSVDELFVMGDHLYAVTHGRGLFRHALSESTEPPVPSLPAPWSTGDVGAVGTGGAASFSNGTFTVRGAGADVWGTADAFRFVYQPLAGDGEIVARVASVQNVAPWAKAGIMIRQSTGAASAHAFMVVSAGRGLAFQRRETSGGATTSTAPVVGAAPKWVKLVRRGQVVTASHSVDGSTWTTAGQSTIALSGTVLVGLAVSSHDTTRTATATFDQVSVTRASGLPSGWLARDIGAVGAAGSTSASGGTFTVRGAGADLWGTADAFHFAYRTLDGDGTIVARVASASGPHEWTKAGIMLRGGTATGATHALMLVSLGKGLAFQRRTAAGGITTHTSGGAGTAPRWLRLVRSGNRVTASTSADGATWTTVGSATIALPSSALVGFAVSSHDPARLATATFDRITLTP